MLRGTARLILVLLASYLFYAWWDYRFVALLIFSTATDYFLGLAIEKNRGSTRKSRLFLLISIISNLGILGFFKYYNFFIDSFVSVFQVSAQNQWMVEVLLPPGISFYTFQTLSYVIDIYRGKFTAEPRFLTFANYVALFPQLVAGPIERPGQLIPQLHKDQRFDWANIYIGSRLFLIGCFKKLVIADNLAPIADAAFSDPASQTSLGLIIAAYCFAIQIYCDFSGYSDMAKGIAKMMGINLSINFNLPYLASSLNDFWRRWHMTLSYWLRDYVYIPLGGSRHGFFKHIRNLLITFALSGLWHGAAWNFVLWGILHGAWISMELILAQSTRIRLPKSISMFITLNVVIALWVLFRTPDLHSALLYYKNVLLSQAGFYRPEDLKSLITFLVYTTPLAAFSIWQYRANTLTPDLKFASRLAHPIMLGMLAFSVVLLGSENGAQFIYFQF
ncbi:MBOAT family protein [Alcaligenaceae bacterium SJ-26]|nr:MBOAT family protein [Alcaligenaceae bacterium SJ-26]